MFPFPSPLLTVAAGGGGGGGATKASNITAGASGSVTVSWPVGAAAGDRALISASGDFAPNTPSGWDALVQAFGANSNGAVFTKVLTSGDISTGSVAVTFAGSGSEVASCVIFSGAAQLHGATGSRTLTTSLASWSGGETGDTLVWFADSEGGAAIPTISRGADLATRGSTPFSRITSETLGSSGAFTATYSFGGDPWGASCAVGGTPTSTLAVRATRITAVLSAASVAYSFPTGSVAGDMCLICAAHGFGVTTPAGWTQLDNSTGSNYNGAIFYKTLSSGDISTGSVTISFGGSFNGSVQGVTFVGAPSSVRTTLANRTAGNSGSFTITTGSSPQIGDIAFYFGSARSATAVYPSINRGSVLAKDSTANAPAIIGQEILTSAGAKAAQFGFANSGGTSGDYTAIVVVTP